MALEISKIRALCFDVDGTLSDTDDLYAQKVASFLPRFLVRDPQHAARRFVMWMEAPGNALMGLPDRFGLDDELAAVINWLSRHPYPLSGTFGRALRDRGKTWKRYLLIPGVDEILARLHGQFPLAVVSARDEHGTRAFLDHFNLTRHFDVIVTALTAEHTKPYPDPILFAAQKMGVAPESCLMIGDTTVDMRAGKSAGAQTVGVLCGFGEEDELKRRGADLILKSTVEVGTVIQAG
ncbi:MAG TPA: HAD family hydrolase [Anaerolineales bacterium]|nr:HAD family hydrolase [Anaerolineales bacterium]